MEKPLGSNWGSPVRNYLKAVHYYEPAPWCAAFVAWCLDSARIRNTITASSGSAQNNANLVYFRAKRLKDIEPGDVGTIYFVSLHRIAHTFFINRDLGNGIEETVEGNSNAGGGREGIGVFRRKRSLNTIWSISRWK